MKIAPQSKLAFHGVDIIDVRMSASRPHEAGNTIDLNITPHIFYPQGAPDHFKVVMEIGLKSESFFTLDIKAIGNFEFEEGTEDEYRQKFANHNAAAIMFPYVRAFVATFSSNLGNTLGLIHLPAQFFNGELPVLTELNEQQLVLPFNGDEEPEC